MTTALVQANQVTKRFGKTVALNQVSFEISDGESIALVGPNGAGKSTLMSIICGFLSPSEGVLEINGKQPGNRDAFGVVGALP